MTILDALLLVAVPITGPLDYDDGDPYGEWHTYAKPVFIGLIALHVTASPVLAQGWLADADDQTAIGGLRKRQMVSAQSAFDRPVCFRPWQRLRRSFCALPSPDCNDSAATKTGLSSVKRAIFIFE